MGKRKLYQFAHIFDPSKYKSETMADGVQAHLDDLQKLTDKYEAKVAVIRTDKNLTVAGKADAFTKLKKDLANELSEWGAFQKHYTSQIERLESEAKPKRHPKDDLVFELRQREIRDYLKTLEPTELEARLRAAAETGEDELLHAVLHAPIPFRLSTAGLIDKIQRQQWEYQNPASAKSLADLQTAQQEVTSALGSVRAAFDKHGLQVALEDAPPAAAA